MAVLGMNKALARQLIATTLPAPEPVLRACVDILVDIGQRESIGFLCLLVRLRWLQDRSQDG